MLTGAEHQGDDVHPPPSAPPAAPPHATQPRAEEPHPSHTGAGAQPQTHLAVFKLTIFVERAQGLYDADGKMFGGSDPYCVCMVGGVKEHRKQTRFQTPTVKNNLNPQWNHKGEISDFVQGQSLVFEVWDHNKISKAVLLGSCELSSRRFLDDGFAGSLELGGTPRAKGTITVKVVAAPPKIPAQLHGEAVTLAALIWPETGDPARPQDIWERVLEQDARLPGDHWECNVRGALDAARNGHWLICTYLAARCFRDMGGANGGAAALSVQDPRCSRTLWMDVAAPIVVDVPRGAERWAERLDDSWDLLPTKKAKTACQHSRASTPGRSHASMTAGPRGVRADYLKTGSTVDLSQMLWRKTGRWRALILKDEDRRDLQKFLFEETVPLPDFLVHPTKEWLDYVPGITYHVLAYPLARDVTKALLRPIVTCWTKEQHTHADFWTRSFGETLISQCAKAGRWDIVELFLKNGVACPDLCVEYEDVCGTGAAVRDAWKRDLFSSVGSLRRSVLERAALPSNAPSPFQPILGALAGTNQLPDFNCPADRQPAVTVRMAESFSWDALRVLLEESDRYCVSAKPLASSSAILRAPAAVQDLAALRLKRGEPPPRPKGPSRTLRSYFERRLAGPVPAAELPDHYSAGDGMIKRRDTGSSILACTLRLGSSTGTPSVQLHLAFVSISEREFADAKMELETTSSPMLPVSLGERVACVTPDGPSGGGFWLPVWCPEEFLRGGGDGDTSILEVPAYCASTPYVSRPLPVRVMTATPCCGVRLTGIRIYVAGASMGETDAHGEVVIHLPPGQHRVSAPDHSDVETIVTVDAGATEEVSCHLGVGGDLFVYLVDASMDDEVQDFVMICSGKEAVSEDAKPFVGKVSLPGATRPFVSGPRGTIHSALQLAFGTRCGTLLSRPCRLRVHGLDGRKAVANEDLGEWLEQDECLMSLLFGNPQRLGTLVGEAAPPPARAPGTAEKPHGAQLPAAEAAADAAAAPSPLPPRQSSGTAPALPGRCSQPHPSRGHSSPAHTRGPVRSAWRPGGSKGASVRVPKAAELPPFRGACPMSRRVDLSGWEVEMRRQQQLIKNSRTSSEQCRPSSAGRRHGIRDDARLAAIRH